MMDIQEMITRMSLGAGRLRALAEGVDDEQARWRPDAGSWSILEVINHLADEEVEDFRTRLDYLLHRPGETAPDIDPVGWVTARGYNRRDLAESLDRFLNERQRSLTWLRGLGQPEWESGMTHPGGQRFTAGDMAASWVCHDLLHTRQLVELQWAWTQSVVAPYHGDYAGPW